jgi:hypothetical protein
MPPKPAPTFLPGPGLANTIGVHRFSLGSIRKGAGAFRALRRDPILLAVCAPYQWKHLSFSPTELIRFFHPLHFVRHLLITQIAVAFRSVAGSCQIPSGSVPVCHRLKHAMIRHRRCLASPPHAHRVRNRAPECLGRQPCRLPARPESTRPSLDYDAERAGCCPKPPVRRQRSPEPLRHIDHATGEVGQQRHRCLSRNRLDFAT